MILNKMEEGIEEPKILCPRITRQSRAQHELTRKSSHRLTPIHTDLNWELKNPLRHPAGAGQVFEESRPGGRGEISNFM